jgi:hypothetical protein
MNLGATSEMMISSDYKERFRAEYLQLKIRIDGLTAMLEKYKAGTLPFKPSCSYELLSKQLNTMALYKMCLEERAEIEKITLEFTEGATSRVRTKFRCLNKEKVDGGANVNLQAVAAGSIENDKFFRYTPGGYLSFYTVNSEAADMFGRDKEYYVDIIPIK